MRDLGKHSSDPNDLVTNATGSTVFVALNDPRLSDARKPLDGSVTDKSLAPKSVTTAAILPGAIDNTVLGAGTVKSVSGRDQLPTDINNVPSIWIGSTTDYTAITTKNNNTIYLITS